MWSALAVVGLIAVFLLGGLLTFKALGNWGMPDKLPPPLKDDDNAAEANSETDRLNAEHEAENKADHKADHKPDY